LKLSIIIPWQDRGDEDRRRAFHYVVNYYSALGIGEVVVGTYEDDGKRFCLARCRNNGVRQASHDIILAVDADTILPLESIQRAYDKIVNGRDIVIPYNSHTDLTLEQTTEVCSGGSLSTMISDAEQHRWSDDDLLVGPAVMFRRSAWELVGGWDEGYTGWSSEDYDFNHAVNIFAGRLGRVEGAHITLHHTPALTLKPDEPDKYRIWQQGVQRWHHKNLLARTPEKWRDYNTTSVSIVIPWLDRGDAERRRVAEYVIDYYRETEIGEVVIGSYDDDGGPLNRSRLRNEGAKRASNDILFFADADVLVPRAQLEAAVFLAKREQGAVLAHDLFRTEATAEDIEKVLSGEQMFEDFLDKDRPSYWQNEGPLPDDWHVGPAYAIRRDAFFEVGGFDEGFVGWGEEEKDFLLRVSKRFQPLRTVSGTVLDLGSPTGTSIEYLTDEGKELFAANRLRMQAKHGIGTQYQSQWDEDGLASPFVPEEHQHISEGSLRSAREVLGKWLPRIGADSVVDIGCGTGEWLQAARENDVEDVLGIDGEWVTPNWDVPIRTADLRNNVKPERRFDLAICLEVGEHLPESAADSLVSLVVGSAPIALFSAAVPGQGGHNHINEQPHDYWLDKFGEYGWAVTAAVRDALSDEVEPWYRQNMFLVGEPETLLRATRPKIAVYAPAKNEEINVEAWAESAREADEVVLVDTGSEDRTVEIAEKLDWVRTEKIYLDPWRFDHGRNTCLALVSKDIDICVPLDLDERLEPGWREALEEGWREGGRHFMFRLEYGPGLVFVHDKIHARHGFQWKGAAHEYPSGPGPKIMTEVQVVHHKDDSKSRSHYMDLLEMEYRESPSPRTTYYWARELYYHNRWEEARRLFQQYLVMPDATYDQERAEASRMMARMVYHHFQEAWLLRACAEAPQRREVWAELAKWYADAGMQGEAAGAAARALKITEQTPENSFHCEGWAWDDDWLAKLLPSSPE
jgi:glycosyltransferase involved in cell wall biosynthesis